MDRRGRATVQRFGRVRDGRGWRTGPVGRPHEASVRRRTHRVGEHLRPDHDLPQEAAHPQSRIRAGERRRAGCLGSGDGAGRIVLSAALELVCGHAPAARCGERRPQDGRLRRTFPFSVRLRSRRNMATGHPTTDGGTGYRLRTAQETSSARRVQGGHDDDHREQAALRTHHQPLAMWVTTTLASGLPSGAGAVPAQRVTLVVYGTTQQGWSYSHMYEGKA